MDLVRFKKVGARRGSDCSYRLTIRIPAYNSDSDSHVFSPLLLLARTAQHDRYHHAPHPLDPRFSPRCCFQREHASGRLLVGDKDLLFAR